MQGKTIYLMYYMLDFKGFSLVSWDVTPSTSTDFTQASWHLWHHVISCCFSQPDPHLGLRSPNLTHIFDITPQKNIS